MKALVSPIEPTLEGYRIVQVEEVPFEVSEPFFWIDCLPNVKADNFYFDPVSKQPVEIPAPPPVTEVVQPVVTGTDFL